MFLHTHPYEPFLFKGATRWIVGTLPPPRFTTGHLKPGDVDFCYGSRDGQLWIILDRIFGLGLKFENSKEAVQQRTNFLLDQKIGICDIVRSAKRFKVDASDLGMQEVQLRDLIACLNKYPSVNTLLFTGGNSKNGPEYFFRRILKEYRIPLKPVNVEIPRIHEFSLPQKGVPDRIVKTVSLIAPSGAANRAVGSLTAYKDMKKANPQLTTLDYRIAQYSCHFRPGGSLK
jgi:G:T/U-mismatch repair DNA glycosylase